MLRAFGAICILTGASTVGFGCAAGVRRQTRQLAELCMSLEMMQSEIEYRMTPLPQLLQQLSTGCQTAVGELLLRWAQILSQPDGATVSYAFRRALGSVHSLALSRQSVQELSALALSLGRFDAAGQARSIAASCARLRQELSFLEAEKRARCRSYCTIGVCAGLALAVILL